jgi:hypothetical protein
MSTRLQKEVHGPHVGPPLCSGSFHSYQLMCRVLPVSQGQFETVSGWVCGAFGYIPRSGESVTVTLKKTRRESRESRDDEQQKKEQEQDHHHRYAAAGTTHPS